MGGEVHGLGSSAVSVFLARLAEPGRRQGRGPGGEPSPRCWAGNRTAGPRLLFARTYLGLILSIPVAAGGRKFGAALNLIKTWKQEIKLKNFCSFGSRIFQNFVPKLIKPPAVGTTDETYLPSKSF